MITIDLVSAVAVYMSFFVGLVIFLWVFRSKAKDKDLSLDPRFIWFCSVCTYTYINTKESQITACPRCGSYNKR